MKKANLLMLIVSGVILFTSCGKDGMNGDTYIAIFDGGEDYVSYWDNNSAVSSGGSFETYYYSSPGTYNYEYTVGDYWAYQDEWSYNTYSGTYTLSVNKGEEGALFKNGDDGRDKYYDFECGYYGSNLSYNNKCINITEPISLSDTTIYFDGYYMIVTRNIMPANYKSLNKPKFQKIKGGL